MTPVIDTEFEQYLNERRLETARHEAGHVLIFLLRGLPFKNVEIVRAVEIDGVRAMKFVLDGEDACLGLMRLDRVAWWTQGCRMGLDDQIMQALAGVAGEQIENDQADWRKGDWRGRANHDYRSAKEIATLAAKIAGIGLRTYLKNSFKEAWKILRQHKARHSALTNALLGKSILTYAECAEIWGTLSNEPSQLSSAPPPMFGSIPIPRLAPRDSEEPL
jgi:hypothetical protein